MTFLDLCTGIGGFSLGLEWAGMTCAGQVEIDPFCNRVLEKHWPHVPRWKDIKNECDYDDYPAVDLVCGGYPCQPFSHAGKRRGADDDHRLWPHVFRIVQRLQPAWCLFENVAGHVTLGLDEVLADLESAGYATRPLIIPACAVDAPHRRDRAWIVANAKCPERRPPQPASHVADGQVAQRRETAGGIGASGADGECGVVADAEDICRGTGLCLQKQAGNGRRQPGDGSGESGDVPDADRAGRQKLDAAAIANEQRHGTGTPAPSGLFWPGEPDVGRVAHGVPSRVDRIKALGNAVVPELVMEIGVAIMAAHVWERNNRG